MEAQLINDSGPTEEQLTYTNATGSSISIVNHEVFSITADTNKDIACVAWASTDVDTIGTCANGEELQVLIAGRVRVDKSTATALEQGHSVYWDAGNNNATTKALAPNSDDFCLGTCVATETATSGKVDVDLNTGPEKHYQGNT